MAIRAVLRKNTVDIRTTIKSLGLSCTEATDEDLLYIENSKSVTWWMGPVKDPTIWDCGEDEKLFFYLISLSSADRYELDSLNRRVEYFKTEYDQCRRKYSEMFDRIWKAEVERDNLQIKLDTVLHNLVNHTLEKENEELKKTIIDLQNQILNHAI